MRRGCLLLLAAAFALTASPPVHSTAQAPELSGRRFALLIGVTEFLDPGMTQYNLQGPANDVALFRRVVLSDRLRFPDNVIVSLAGLPEREADRPTRANIERAFRALRDKVRPGDQVAILLAGHGSQQPANPDPTDEEPDGLDEIFLPADAAGWDPSKGVIANAIVDDDLRQWVGDIRNKGAAVWIVVDACHSGTVTRAGTGAARDRGIRAETLIPIEALTAAGASVRSSSRATDRAFDFATAPDITALYAANATETTPELPMPDRNGPVHGLFTYTLTRILAERAVPTTSRDLMQRVIDQYRSEGFGPTPAFEGNGVDREVLGDRVIASRGTFAIELLPDTNQWTVSAGRIHGLTAGSILQVVPPSGSPDATSGHLRVAAVSPTAALAEPVAVGNVPAPTPTQIPRGSRARVRVHEFGALRLRVVLQVEEARQPGAVALERALDALENLSDGLAARVAGPDGDWFVHVDRGRVVLSDALRRFDVAALDDERLPERLAGQMRRVARAANLARLASYVDADASLSVRVLRHETRTGQPVPLLSSTGQPSVTAGQFLQFVVRNTGTVPLDVTVLYVDANFGIYGLFPAGDSALDNRLDPGRERMLPLAEISADPFGWESVVAVGVEASPRRENFLTLAQDSLSEATRSSRPPSPVRALLESAMSTRSSRATAVEGSQFAITQTWFHVEPPAR